MSLIEEPSLIETLARDFSEDLLEIYRHFRERGVEPGTLRRLDSLLIFAALERSRLTCASHFGLESGSIWCRYTIGMPTSPEAAHILAIFGEVRLKNEFKLSPSNSLTEFAFDFSLTSLARHELIAKDDPPPGQFFRFLLIAESELWGANEAADDFARLIAASAPVKILVYNSIYPEARELYQTGDRALCPDRGPQARTLARRLGVFGCADLFRLARFPSGQRNDSGIHRRPSRSNFRSSTGTSTRLVDAGVESHRIEKP